MSTTRNQPTEEAAVAPIDRNASNVRQAMIEQLRSLIEAEFATWKDHDFVDEKKGWERAIHRLENVLHRQSLAWGGVPGVYVSPEQLATSLGVVAQRHIDEQNDEKKHAQTSREKLIELQYTAAREFPNEYTIFIGSRIVFHSKDRNEALDQYYAAFDDQNDELPSIVEPNATAQIEPNILRGRALARL